MMRRYEHAFLMILFLAALSCSGVWLWTEISYHRVSVLVDQTIVGKAPSPEELFDVLAKFRNPRSEILPGNHLFDESTLAIGAAERLDLPEAKRLQWIKQTRESLYEALMREPANSRGWMYLAYTTWLMDGPGINVVKALRMSIYSGPANRQILLWRLKLAGLNRDFWDSDFRNLLKGQIDIAWDNDQKSFAEIADTFHLKDLAQKTLSDNPEELARFEAVSSRTH
jgi:hypothetical protein